MDLRDYPRPKDDTGIGVHWNAGYAAAIGLGQIEQIWLPRLLGMGIKWVKISDHDGALGFADLLLKNGIMPIVRIYRPQPNPGVLNAQQLKAVSDFVSAGVRYFEFNNEPDLGVEWQGGEVPLDGAPTVAANAIIDMEAILQRGGYPGIPALRPGGRWDLVGEICRLGRRDLLSQPVWQALHNYSADHPLDYPYDLVNQEGAPCSRELYDKLALEKWKGDAWEGWTLEQLNQFRRERANPGATAVGDPTCWRAYERYDQLIRNQIGRSLPILATENGFVVGERQDKRYSTTTPQLHALQTLEACRIMMGASGRYDHAPDYYFCTAFWLIGNFTLGSWAPAWENAAWFSRDWQDGQLPIVAALTAEPKRVRTWRGDAGLPGRVFGALRNGPNLPLTLKLVRQDDWLATTQSASDGQYEFTDLPLDRFTLTIIEAGMKQDVTLTRERPTAAVNFDLNGAVVRLASSVVSGAVQGGAGMIVLLTRQSGTAWEERQLVAADGAYRFTELEAGTYTLKLLDTSVVKPGIVLDGRNAVALDLAVPGWGWQIADGGSGPGFGMVRCRVTGRPDLPVRLWSAGWSGMSLRTGSKPEFGNDVCEFAPLGASTYKVQPEGIKAVAEVPVDGSRIVWLTFIESATPPASSGAIFGTVTSGGAGRVVRLLLPPGSSPLAQGQCDADGRYRFDKLAAGSYTIQVMESDPAAGVAVQKTGVAVDGVSAVQADLQLPSSPVVSGQWSVKAEDGGAGPGFCVVRCQIEGEPNREVRLWTAGWSGMVQRTGSKAEYGPDACEFAPLGSGRYTVEPFGLGESLSIELDLPANRVVWVRYHKVAAEKKEGVIAGKVTNGEGREVRLTGPLQQQTVVKDGRYRFEQLPAGTYRVSVMEADPTLGEAAGYGGISTDGTGEITVDFVLPALPASQSVITGRIKGGAGRVVKLEGPNVSRAITVGVDETYRFAGLPAGAYNLTVSDSEPPSGTSQSQPDIQVNGANTVQVDIDLTTIGPAKTIEHYLLVGSMGRTRDDFVTSLRYVSRFQPAVGTDEAEARKARHVTILGSVNAISALVEQGLRMAGCQVQRIDGDYAGGLGKLLAEDRPY